MSLARIRAKRGAGRGSRLKCTLLSFQRPAPPNESSAATKSLRLAPEASGVSATESYPIRSKALQYRGADFAPSTSNGRRMIATEGGLSSGHLLRNELHEAPLSRLNNRICKGFAREVELGDEPPPLRELRVGDPHRAPEHLFRRRQERDVVPDRRAHLRSVPGEQERRRQDHLRLETVLRHHLAPREQVVELVGAAELDV